MGLSQCLALLLFVANAPIFAKRVVKAPPAHGFGAKPVAAKPQMAPELSSAAKDSLRRARGDVGHAHALLYEHYIAEAADDASRQHATRVRATWDTIAAFMPLSGDPSAVDKPVARKLSQIASAAMPLGSLGTVLDVGCGNGLLLPPLLRQGMPASGFHGIDVSQGMLDLAAGSHAEAIAAGARFQRASWQDLVCADNDVSQKAAAVASSPYAAVVFNGVFQFFDRRDWLSTLQVATRIAPRLVLAHVNGAAFVREEAAGNPATVLSEMPKLHELRKIGRELGCDVEVLTHLGLVSVERRNHVGFAGDDALETFYLATLSVPEGGGGDV